MTTERSYGLGDAAATEAFGARLAGALRPGDVVALSGDLGAGKTTLARGILRGLGFRGEAPSPTFTLVQLYEPPELRLPVLHADLYRLQDPAEVLELGLEDWREDAAMLIEWPERGGRYLPQAAFAIRIDGGAADGRRLTVRSSRAWE